MYIYIYMHTYIHIDIQRHTDIHTQVYLGNSREETKYQQNFKLMFIIFKSIYLNNIHGWGSYELGQRHKKNRPYRTTAFVNLSGIKFSGAHLNSQ